jgi:hypothetical protein
VGDHVGIPAAVRFVFVSLFTVVLLIDEFALLYITLLLHDFFFPKSDALLGGCLISQYLSNIYPCHDQN